MVKSVRFTFAIISILGFVSAGYGECGLRDLVIGTTRSGREVQGKTEWNVQIVNNCICSQSRIVVGCKDFQTLEAVDPSIFQKIGDECSVNGGRPLKPQADVRFSYAWDQPFFFFPFSSKSAC